MSAAPALTLQLCRTFLADRDGDVAVVRMFVDESGIHAGSPSISVAAYLSRPTKWNAFTREWQRLLKRHKIEIFHTTDCNGLRGEFAGWTREARDKFVAQLLPTIPRYANGCGISIDLKALEAELEKRPELRRFHRDPYGACFQWVLMTVLDRLLQEGTPRPIAVVHENNDYRASAMAAFDHVQKNERGGEALKSISFGSKQDFVPLQAADILAFETGRRVLNMSGPERKSLTVLRAGGRLLLKSFNASNIGDYVDMLAKLKRQYEAGLLADGAKYDARPSSRRTS